MNLTQASGSKDTFAMALVIFINWIIAHDANAWVMPPEVQSAVQAIIAIVTGYLVARKQNKITTAPPALPPVAEPQRQAA